MSIQQKKAKIKGVSDIVFCIDLSASMTPCINGVKDHVTTFVSHLEKENPNMVIDWQLAFCGYNSVNFYYSDFINDAYKFQKIIDRTKVERYNEYTPGAIDFCINHFDWRPVSNKFLIVFTDETLKGGKINSDTLPNFQQLLDEITDNKIRLFFFGPKDSYYGEFEKLSRSFVNFIDRSFDSVNFSDLLSSLGKTVSQSIGQQGGPIAIRKNNVYDLSEFSMNKL